MPSGQGRHTPAEGDDGHAPDADLGTEDLALGSLCRFRFWGLSKSENGFGFQFQPSLNGGDFDHGKIMRPVPRWLINIPGPYSMENYSHVVLFGNFPKWWAHRGELIGAKMVLYRLTVDGCVIGTKMVLHRLTYCGLQNP